MAGGAVSGTVKDNVVITLVYSLDEKDPDDPENPNKPDDVPDKYQAVVTYTVVNGTFGDDGEQVTQYYELAAQNDNGTWTPETKTLSDIPTPTANTGYENGSWDTVPTDSTPVVDLSLIHISMASLTACGGGSDTTADTTAAAAEALSLIHIWRSWT